MNRLSANRLCEGRLSENNLSKDRRTLKRLVESYGKYDVINFVKNSKINESIDSLLTIDRGYERMCSNTQAIMGEYLAFKLDLWRAIHAVRPIDVNFTLFDLKEKRTKTAITKSFAAMCMTHENCYVVIDSHPGGLIRITNPLPIFFDKDDAIKVADTMNANRKKLYSTAKIMDLGSFSEYIKDKDAFHQVVAYWLS